MDFGAVVDCRSMTGCRMRDPKTVPFNSRWELVHPMSPDRLRAVSGITFFNGKRRDSPTASVSSVKGVGANTPVPADTRTVQCCSGRNKTETRGLKKRSEERRVGKECRSRMWAYA